MASRTPCPNHRSSWSRILCVNLMCIWEPVEKLSWNKHRGIRFQLSHAWDQSLINTPCQFTLGQSSSPSINITNSSSLQMPDEAHWVLMKICQFNVQQSSIWFKILTLLPYFNWMIDNIHQHFYIHVPFALYILMWKCMFMLMTSSNFINRSLWGALGGVGIITITVYVCKATAKSRLQNKKSDAQPFSRHLLKGTIAFRRQLHV